MNPFIEKVQIEEGFLRSVNLEFSPGFNAIIGERGTGKTSLIELIRFCLGVRGYTSESTQKSHDHALSVLRSGQVTVTIRAGDQRVVVTRSASEDAPRATAPFSPPIIFSQTEIEAVGLQSQGRLRLVDGFLLQRSEIDSAEELAAAEVRSLTAEIESLRREVSALEAQTVVLPQVEEQLAKLQPAEQSVSKISADAALRKTQLDSLIKESSETAIAGAYVQRFSDGIKRWFSAAQNTLAYTPTIDPWPGKPGADPIAELRPLIDELRIRIEAVGSAITKIQVAGLNKLERLSADRISIEERARLLRAEIEKLQEGAGNIMRDAQQLREKKAQIDSLKAVVTSRQAQIDELVKRRSAAFERLEKTRDQRYRMRVKQANTLSSALGPQVRVEIIRAGQVAQFATGLTNALRGSGLKYNDLVDFVATKLSPRELIEAVELDDLDQIRSATGISRDRAGRLIAALKHCDLGELATLSIDDTAEFKLLDGRDYKPLQDLSTGQRCTVVLPLIMQHTDKILIVDQPEDHIDNAFIADTLIKAIHNRRGKGQLIVSTHNANIPVLGDADRVIQLGSDGGRGFILRADGLETPPVVNAISTLLEGGRDAFAKRAKFYAKSPP